MKMGGKSWPGGEEVFGRPGEEDGEPAEEENQKRGGRLLLKKRWV